MLVSSYERLQESPVQILLGECKTSGPIDENDVRKLGKLADAVPRELADAYIIFSKTDTFSVEEIEVAKSLNSEYHRPVILWSVDELEPYFLYERSKTKLGEAVYAHSLSDMANATSKLFFGDQ